MGMSEKTYIGIRDLVTQRLERLARVVSVEQIQVLVLGRAVAQHDPLGRLNRPLRNVAQPVQVGRGQHPPVPARRGPSDVVEVAVTGDAGDHLVVVAADAVVGDRQPALQARRGVGVVADQVAQEQVRVDADRQGVQRRLHRLQRFEVAVDVGQDGVGHGPIRRGRRSVPIERWPAPSRLR